MKRIILFFALIIFSFSQGQVINSFVSSKYSDETKRNVLDYFNNKKKITDAKIADFLKTKNIPFKLYKADGSFSELFDITSDGFPLYYSLDNLDAANSTRTNFMHSGFSGLGIEGEGMTIGVWDGASALQTHNEFKTSATNPLSRMTIGDTYDINANSFHATHVSGTLVARGNQLQAKGMAPKSSIISYSWTNDQNEVVTAATNGLLISNHSYGVPLFDDSGALNVPNWLPGSYSSSSRSWDIIHYNFPYFLAVMSAGNEGSPSNPSALEAGFDKLTGNKTSKNNLVVANAQDANVNVFTGALLTPVSINNSSSEGPTDDFRVKPDITGNGTNLYSSIDSSISSYDTISGTSMASPNVAGSILLLQQYYFSLFSDYMLSATLKGLVCHTADDSGNIGPDPVFGWGLLNMKEASSLITKKNSNLAVILENTLVQNQIYNYDFSLNTVETIKVSICWTDVPGAINEGNLNDSTPALINNLDVRVIKDGTEVFLPWKINPIDVSTAIKGDNNVDNFELITIENAQPGNYQVVVSHKGVITNASQNYSLIISGNNIVLSNKVFDSSSFLVYPNPAENILNIDTSNQFIKSYAIYDNQGRIVKDSRLNSGVNFTIDISNLQSGIYLLKINSSDKSITKKFIKK